METRPVLVAAAAAVKRPAPVTAAAAVKRLGPVVVDLSENRLGPFAPKAPDAAVAADAKELGPVAGADPKRLKPAKGLPDDGGAEVLAANALEPNTLDVADGTLALELEQEMLAPNAPFEAAASVNETTD